MEYNGELPPPPAGMSYRIEKLNPLAFPKGQSLVCEMTGKPAMVSCVSDYITLHFASAEIAKQAWDGVLCRVAHVIGPILAPPALMGSEEERDRRQQAAHASKLALIVLCRDEAARHLVKGDFELAVPAASYALRFTTAIYGEGRVELVPAYLLLAEANLGILKYRQAEEYLTLANWAVLKTPSCSNALRSQLRRNFGRLYASQGKYEEALRQLADDVYYSSLMVRARD
jgi:tetratricopeptide (TPR) repeat protein